MEKKKKNIKFIAFCVAVGLVAIVGLLSAFMMNYNSYSPEAPTILDDGKNIFISTSFNDNYIGYKFKFKDEQGEEVFVESEDNVVDANEMISAGGQVGKNYDVSVCFLARNSGNNSQYSEKVEWTCETYLFATEISFDEFENKLNWTDVLGADFYRIYFNNASEENYVDTIETNLDLHRFEGGDKSFYVVAHSQNNHIKQSEKSNVLDLQLKHYFLEFDKIIGFDAQTKILTAQNFEKLKKLEIVLGGIGHECIKFDVEEQETNDGKIIYVYKVDLTTIYNGERVIGIRPANIDLYNVYVGGTTSFTLS